VGYNAAVWLVDRHVGEGRGASTAIRYEGQSITYADVLTGVYRVQSALDDLGVVTGDRVLMVMNDDPAFIAWFLGCVRSGVVPVPISTMLTGADVASIAADCGAKVLAISAENVDRLPSIAAGAPDLATVVIHGDGDALPSAPSSVMVRSWASFPPMATHAVAETTWDSPGFWLYSSGTTGLPKGVIHKHGDLQASFDTYATQVLHVTSADVFLSVAKLFFAYGLGNSLTFPFAAGATTVLESRRPTPAIFRQLVATEKPTLFFAAPGFVAALLDSGVTAEEFTSVRASVTAGEALPADLQRRFSERCRHPVLDGIGSTEATHIFLSNTLDTQAPGTSGQVVPGYAAKLLDDQGDEVTEPDLPGYLHVQGPSIMTGYWNQPDATAGALADGWLRTGDVYQRDASGNWAFLGRNSDMIKAGGIWVSPAEVEAALISHEDVLEAAVVGARNADGLEETVAFVVPASGHPIDLGVIDSHCRSQIAAFKRPRRVIVLDALPKTATGKIQRFALRDILNKDV
jgi:benzoate-CoA ligase family protein